MGALDDFDFPSYFLGLCSTFSTLEIQEGEFHEINWDMNKLFPIFIIKKKESSQEILFFFSDSTARTTKFPGLTKDKTLNHSHVYEVFKAKVGG